MPLLLHCPKAVLHSRAKTVGVVIDIRRSLLTHVIHGRGRKLGAVV